MSCLGALRRTVRHDDVWEGNERWHCPTLTLRARITLAPRVWCPVSEGTTTDAAATNSVARKSLATRNHAMPKNGGMMIHAHAMAPNVVRHRHFRQSPPPMLKRLLARRRPTDPHEPWLWEGRDDTVPRQIVIVRANEPVRQLLSRTSLLCAVGMVPPSTATGGQFQWLVSRALLRGLQWRQAAFADFFNSIKRRAL
jgi:hypothetical protein